MSGQENINVANRGGDAVTHQVVADVSDGGFQDELFNYFNRHPKANDSQVERVSATGGGTSDTGTKSPYDYARKAAIAEQELQQLMSKNLPDTATVNDGTGDKTVADLRKQLQLSIRDQFSTGIGQADAIKQDGSDDSINGALTKFRQDPNGDAKRQSLANEFHLDPANMNMQDVQALQQQQGLTAQQKQDAKTLLSLESQFEELNQMAIAPSVLRMQYANALAQGMLNPDAAGAKNGDVPLSDAMDAYKLVHQAGVLDKTGDVRNTPEYQALQKGVDTEYGQSQSQRAVQMIQACQQATELEGKGDTKGAEDAYKKAMQSADGVDLSYFINNIANQTDVNIKKQMLSTIVGVETTREKYAGFLLRQGRPSEALPLLSKIQGQVPDLVRNDQGFNELLNWALSGQKTEGDSPYPHLNNIDDAMKKKDYATAFKEAQAAQTAVSGMDMTAVQKDVDALKQQQTDLKAQQDTLAKDASLSDDAKTTQANLLKQQIGVNAAMLDMEQKKLNLPGHVKYLQGYTAYLQGQNDAAHGFFEDFKKNYPDLASQPEYNIDAALKATEHKGWLRRNIGWVAPVAGFAAALGAAALTIWSGPGAFAAGAAAFGATEATLGGAALLGTAAAVGIGTGTLAYVGTTAVSGEKVTGKTWLEGAGWATLGASTVVAPGLAGELGVTLGILPSADAVATTVGGKIAMGAITGAIVSVPHAGIDFADNIAYNGDSVGGASWKFVKEAGIGTATGGLSGRFGMSMGNVARWSTLPSLLGPGIQGTVQNYRDIHAWAHGPLDPTGDREQIANLNDALPGEYTVPEIRVVPQQQQDQSTNSEQDPTSTNDQQ
ncbi:MAG TPA: hypothetical protein V6C81_14200 [Planktothrix sp.]|jgi:hypothetical protein